MGSAIEAVKGHYSSLARKKIPVPEWGLDIYARPTTLADVAKVKAYCDGDLDKWYAAAIVVMAEDESGNRLFGLGDMNDMVKNSDSDLVLAVGAKILSKATPEQQAGN